MINVHIVVPIGGRDVNELRLFLAIFGADDMTNDGTFIVVHTSVDETIFSAVDILSNQVVIDSCVFQKGA